MIKILDYPTLEALLSSAEGVLRSILPTSGNLMLSGGSTPYVLYNRLAARPCPVHTDRRLFLSDERMVPFRSDHNNAHNLEPMLQALDCTDRFIRVDTSLPAQEAAEKFETCLQPMKAVDVGFLGMGTDGHTAGFFTREQAQMKSGALTLCTRRPDGMQGVSVTPAFFQKVRKIILLVTGESKRAIINT
ncbi:MAG: hypothetical protein HKP10_09530, partial [Kiritimatiellales bacterium]|nr:hypothetical protein [Kiritimatiellales bacterium]